MAAQLPHIFLIGATGRVGRLVLTEALRRGHTVTALVRKSTSLEPVQYLDIVQGDPTNPSDIDRALSQATSTPSKPIVIISTLGQTRKSGNPWAAVTSPAGFMAASANAVLSAVSSNKFPRVQKFVGMSMFGAGDSFQNLNFLMRMVMNYSNMAQTVEDHNLVDAAIKQGSVNFVLVRAAMLKGDQVMEVKIHGDGGTGAGFMPSISPQSVAVFLLDAAVSQEWDGRTPVISN